MGEAWDIRVSKVILSVMKRNESEARELSNWRNGEFI